MRFRWARGTIARDENRRFHRLTIKYYSSQPSFRILSESYTDFFGVPRRRVPIYHGRSSATHTRINLDSKNNCVNLTSPSRLYENYNKFSVSWTWPINYECLLIITQRVYRLGLDDIAYVMRMRTEQLALVPFTFNGTWTIDNFFLRQVVAISIILARDI